MPSERIQISPGCCDYTHVTEFGCGQHVSSGTLLMGWTTRELRDTYGAVKSLELPDITSTSWHRVEALMGQPESLEGGGDTPAWVGRAGAWGGVLSCHHQAFQWTSGSKRVPWLPCQVSQHVCMVLLSLHLLCMTGMPSSDDKQLRRSTQSLPAATSVAALLSV